jgi:hypothetical protein
MQELTFTLTIDDANKILEGLGNLPFKDIHELISKIQAQAATQLQDGPKQEGNRPSDLH